MRERDDIELPLISFARSRAIGDCTIDKVDLVVSAEDSKKCFKQFKDLIKFIDEEDKRIPQQQEKISGVG